MKILIVALGTFVMLTAWACGGPTALTPTPGETGAVTTGAAGSMTPVVQTGACGPTGDRYRPTSIDALAKELHGTWTLCSPLGLFRRPQDAVLIGDDDKFVFLTNVNGAFVRQQGAENKGHLEYIDTSAYNGSNTFQVNFVSDLGVTITSVPVLSDVPRLVVIDNNGVDEYRYARAGSSPMHLPPSGPAPGDIKQPSGDVPCQPMGAQFNPATSDELGGALRGTWVMCSSMGLFRKPQAGLYIGPDDRWVLLERRDGALVPLTGLDNQGRVDRLPGNHQTNFVSDLGGTIIAAPPVFNDSPRLLTINNNGVDLYTYALVR